MFFNTIYFKEQFGFATKHKNQNNAALKNAVRVEWRVSLHFLKG